MYSTYIIYALRYDLYYIGQTNNLADRLLRHNGNRNKYTKNKGPWELVFKRDFATRSEALALERQLKSFKNKSHLKTWIAKNGGLDRPDLLSGGSA